MLEIERYKESLKPLLQLCGEQKYAYYRFVVMQNWYDYVCKRLIPKYESEIFDDTMIMEVLGNALELERHTRHDIKAMEYAIRKRVKYPRYVHFCMTSQDVVSLATAMYINPILDRTRLEVYDLLSSLKEIFTNEHRIVAKTHGQSAVVSTLKHHMDVYVHRISNIKIDRINNVKCFGAVGNKQVIKALNLETVIMPQEFLNKFGYHQQPSTQTDNWYEFVKICHNYHHLSAILIDLCQNLWGYISDGEISLMSSGFGSSTMYQKSNPIEFENAEGNFKMSMSKFSHYTKSLPISRFYRDLSDSVQMRFLHEPFLHLYLGIAMLKKGLKRISYNHSFNTHKLLNSYESLTEIVQTFIRMKLGDDVTTQHVIKNVVTQNMNTEQYQDFLNNLEKSLGHRLEELRGISPLNVPI